MRSDQVRASLACRARQACKALASALAARGLSLKDKLSAGVGFRKVERLDDAMPEDVWRANVLFMLKSLEQSIQRLLARSDAASTATTPRTWHLSEHMSASEDASPLSRLNEVDEPNLNGELDIARSPAANLLNSFEDGRGIAGFLDTHSIDEVDKAVDLLETLESIASRDSADASGHNRIGPPPPSWGQVDSCQRLSRLVQADVANAEEHPPAHVSDAPGSLSEGASARESRDSTTTPPPTSRVSWEPQADMQWFARSPCFRLSSAQQVARLQAAQSCVVDPPPQEATYGALLSRLPQELRT
jgi:hypothetical protein